MSQLKLANEYNIIYEGKTLQSYLLDMKIILGEWKLDPPHRWYECGEVYQSRTEEAICHKYAGHPGHHAKRRRSTPMDPASSSTFQKS